MSDLASLIARSAALHDHLCPRQVLGVRMGMYAADLLQGWWYNSATGQFQCHVPEGGQERGRLRQVNNRAPYRDHQPLRMTLDYALGQCRPKL